MRTWRKLADSYFDTYYFPTNPSAATPTGIHQYDGKLEDYSRAGVDAQVKALKSWEAQVAAVDPSSLDRRRQGRSRTAAGKHPLLAAYP